jgi:hypothetical protein
MSHEFAQKVDGGELCGAVRRTRFRGPMWLADRALGEVAVVAVP